MIATSTINVPSFENIIGIIFKIVDIINDVFIDNRISINFVLMNGNDLKYLEDITFHDEYELIILLS